MINFSKPKTMARGFRQVSIEAAILISVPLGLVWLALSSEFHNYSRRKVLLPSEYYRWITETHKGGSKITH